MDLTSAKKCLANSSIVVIGSYVLFSPTGNCTTVNEIFDTLRYLITAGNMPVCRAVGLFIGRQGNPISVDNYVSRHNDLSEGLLTIISRIQKVVFPTLATGNYRTTITSGEINSGSMGILKSGTIHLPLNDLHLFSLSNSDTVLQLCLHSTTGVFTPNDNYDRLSMGDGFFSMVPIGSVHALYNDVVVMPPSNGVVRLFMKGCISPGSMAKIINNFIGETLSDSAEAEQEYKRLNSTHLFETFKYRVKERITVDNKKNFTNFNKATNYIESLNQFYEVFVEGKASKQESLIHICSSGLGRQNFQLAEIILDELNKFKEVKYREGNRNA